MVIRLRIQRFIQIAWEMTENLAFKERPSFGHGLFIIIIILQSDYKTSLLVFRVLSEAITVSKTWPLFKC